jgi:hypothetical protein
LVSITNAQRRFLREANWIATVHHGLPRDPLTLGVSDGNYLAFLGRISPGEASRPAIAIAR